MSKTCPNVDPTKCRNYAPVSHPTKKAFWFSITGVFIAIALAILVPTWLYNRALVHVKEQSHRNTQEIIDRQVANCDSQNTNRITLRKVLEQVAIPPAGRVIDFHDVKGWTQLDPNTQLYVANLLQALRVGTPNTFLIDVLKNYRKSNPLQDCNRVRTQAENRLHYHPEGS